MADEKSITPTVITNVRSVEAPTPPLYGITGDATAEEAKRFNDILARADQQDTMSKILRRLAALEKAVNGKVSE